MNWIKTHPLIAGLIAVCLAIFLGLWLWFYGTWAWNGIGNFIFHRQINAERVKVQKELDSAVEQKKALEQTLFELKAAKEALAEATKQRELAEKLFYDQNKTSSQKVAEYKAALSAAPVRTDPTGVTTSDLCARAKSANSSADLITALCGN